MAHQTRVTLGPMILIFINSLSHAQPANYTTIQFNTDNGLPQSSVKFIAFDKAGYCWMATEMGLVRFDGSNFRIYGMSEIPGITTERIKILAPDISGELYALSSNNERIKVNSLHFPRSPFPEFIRDTTKFLPVIGYVTSKAYIDSLNEITFLKYNRPPPVGGLSNADGETYLSNEENLYYISKNGAQELHGLYAGVRKWGNILVNDKYYLHLFPGNKIQVWKNGVLDVLKNSISGPIQNDRIYLSGKAKVLWCKEGTFVYSGKKLYSITTANEEISSKLVLDNLDIRDLTCMYYSKEQNKYYFGSYVDGLYIVEISSFHYPTVPDYVNTENYYPQSETSSGQIFASDFLFAKDKSSIYIPVGSKNGATHLITAHDQLYFDKNFHLSRYDLNTKRNYPLLKLDRRLRFVKQEGENIIFSTERSIGILSKDSLILKKEFPNQIRVITAIKLDKENFLLGTESGLKWYNLPGNKVYRSILDSLQIRTIYRDSGRLWLSSYGKGFFLYEKGKIYNMPFGSKHSLKTVHAFIKDGSGYFWLPTNNGLFKVLKSELLNYAHAKSSSVYFYMLSKQNGLRTNEFNGGCDPSFLRMKDGMLSLPSINGLVWFYPEKVNFLYPDKKIYIDGLFLDKKEIVIPKGPIVLKPSFSELSFQISCPYFGNAQNINLEYKISSLTNTWNPVPANGEIKLARTPSGNYKLIVRRRSGDKYNDYEFLELKLIVKPWFYNTWWFYSLLIFGFGLIAYAIARRRIKAVTERSDQLELLIAARTTELSIALQQVAESESALLKSVKEKDNVITMVLHDLRSPISFLSTVTDRLATNYQSLNASDLGILLKELQSGTKALRGFTEHFFIWATRQHADFAVTNASFKLQRLFDELIELYSTITKSKGNLLAAKSTSLVCHTDFQILALIVRNLLDNANKNTANGRIELSAVESDCGLVIYVKDSGKGLTAKQIEDFMDESQKIGQDRNGSILITSMIRKINGKLDIHTSADNGSMFIITLCHPSQPDISEQDC